MLNELNNEKTLSTVTGGAEKGDEKLWCTCNVCGGTIRLTRAELEARGHKCLKENCPGTLETIGE